MGAAYLAELIKSRVIDEREGERLLPFCNNSGPAFLIGAIGAGVFSSASTGILLYLVHIAAALLTGLLLRGKGAPSDAQQSSPEEAPPLSRLLPEAVQQAVPALLNVCGFVVCFTVFTGLLETNGLHRQLIRILAEHTPLESQAIRALLIGFWELGGGIGALRGLSPTPLNLALAAALVGWGGISVHFQTLAVLADTDIKSALHTAGRLIHAVLSFLLCFALASLFKS